MFTNTSYQYKNTVIMSANQPFKFLLYWKYSGLSFDRWIASSSWLCSHHFVFTAAIKWLRFMEFELEYGMLFSVATEWHSSPSFFILKSVLDTILLW